jgi:hypothetical protein
MKKKAANLYFSGIIIILSVLIYFLIIPYHISHRTYIGMSPMAFPRLATMILGISSIIVFVKSLKITNEDMMPLTKQGSISVVIFVIGVLVYLLCMNLLGFYTSTFLSLICSMLFLGYRRVSVIILVGILLIVSIYLLFENGLGIRMPKGYFM